MPSQIGTGDCWTESLVIVFMFVCLQVEHKVTHTVPCEQLPINHVQHLIPTGENSVFLMYDELTGGVKNGKPVEAILKLEYNGKCDDGFAAEYSGVYFVREVISLK